MGQIGDKYLERWHEYSRSDEALELRADYDDIYTEITGFLSEQMLRGRLDRNTLINMCYGLIIHHSARLGVCPACELYEASEEIHEGIGCLEVH
jgi:hypothetical protein